MARGLVLDESAFNNYLRKNFNTTSILNAAGEYKNDYDKSVLDAYTSSMKQKSNIIGSNIGEGFKDEYLSSLSNNLNSAYDNYRINYLSNINNLNDEVDSLISERASLFSKSVDSLYTYLDYLYNYYDENPDLTNPFTSDENWSKYLNNGELVNINELKGEHLTYDEEGNVILTSKGTDFFDQMLNAVSSGVIDGVSYEQYLYDNDMRDILEWQQSEDVYNNNSAGTNLGTLKEALGMSSTDYNYKFAERAFGKTEQEINSMFDSFKNKIRDEEDLSSIVNSIKSFAEQYGLVDSSNEIDWNELLNRATIVQNNMNTNIQNNKDNNLNIAASATVFSLAAIATVLVPGAATFTSTIAALSAGNMASSISNSVNGKGDYKNSIKAYDDEKEYLYSTILKGLANKALGYVK